MASVEDVPGGDWLSHYPARTLATPQAPAMPFAPLAAHLKTTEYAQPTGTSRLLRDVLYCAPNNMLLTPGRRLIAEASSTEREPERFKWEHLFEPEVEAMGGLCTGIRSLRSNYYHSLVDDLPRLFLLHHPAYADRELRLLLPGGPNALEAFFLERLAPPNLTVVPVAGDRLYACHDYLFPGFLSRRFAAVLPPEYLAFFRARLLPDRPGRRDRRILISRRKAPNGRGIRNEDQLADALTPLGFQSYLLEDLDLAAQIDLFHDAEAVVAPHGAGLTNLLFAEDAKVLELHPNPVMFPHYYYLCRSLGHDYRYWCGSERTRFCAFDVDVGAVLGQLREMGIG